MDGGTYEGVFTEGLPPQSLLHLVIPLAPHWFVSYHIPVGRGTLYNVTHETKALSSSLATAVLGVLLMDTSTLGQVEPEIEPPFNPLNPGSTFCFVDNLFMNH